MPEIDFDAETTPDAWDALREAEPELAGHLAVRVACGAVLFDGVRPGWTRAVRLDTLAMGSDDENIVGQVFDSLGSGLQRLAEPIGAMTPHAFGLVLTPAERSFCGSPETCKCGRTEARVAERFAALTALWVRAARSRLAAGRGEVADA